MYNDLGQLPMNPTEEHLKTYMESHTTLKNHILTGKELSDFLKEMIIRYDGIAQKDVRHDFPEAESVSPDHFYDAPERYEHQTMSQFISSNSDISVNRMLRYMPAHWHTSDYFEMYFVFSGVCPLLLEDTTLSMEPGTVVILSGTQRHATPCYKDDCVLFSYMFRKETFEKVFWNNLSKQNLISTFFRQALAAKEDTAYLCFKTGNDAEIRQILTKVYEEFQKGNAYYEQMMNALMNTFFVLLLQRYENTVLLPKKDQLHWKQDYMGILTYIQKHYPHLTLGELSQRFGYSERHLNRIIQKYTGKSFSKIIVDLRMEVAASLLQNTDLSIPEISTRIGYENLSSFYRAFANHYNSTPAEYRKNAYHP